MRRLLALTLLASAAPAQTVQSSVSPDVWASLQFCSTDHLYHFKTSACPAPSGWVPSPSLSGATFVDDGSDPNLALQPTWGSGTIPGSAAPDDVWASLQFCSTDHLYHFKTSACPAPSGWVPSPSLSGATFVDDGSDPNLALQPTWGSGTIPGSAAPDVVGAFRFICQAGQLLPDDPIVFPGQPGKSHLHQFYGNEGANTNSTYASLRTSGTSTCNRGVVAPQNRSAYWMPAMLDASGVPVKPVTVSIYYKRRPSSDPKCSLTSGDPKAEGNCLPIPNGLRFIFGWDPTGANSTKTGEAYFACNTPTAVVQYPDLDTAAASCPAGNKLGAVIQAPECWDGKNLDAPDHRSHVAYPGYGTWGYLKCDTAHPYVIPTFKLGAWFLVPTGGAVGWSLSSDAMVSGKPKGYTWHADYWEAWGKVKATWTANCIDGLKNASGGDLCNGLQLKGAQ